MGNSPAAGSIGPPECPRFKRLDPVVTPGVPLQSVSTPAPQLAERPPHGLTERPGEPRCPSRAGSAPHRATPCEKDPLGSATRPNRAATLPIAPTGVKEEASGDCDPPGSGSNAPHRAYRCERGGRWGVRPARFGQQRSPGLSLSVMVGCCISRPTPVKKEASGECDLPKTARNAPRRAYRCEGGGRWGVRHAGFRQQRSRRAYFCEGGGRWGVRCAWFGQGRSPSRLPL
jgi:hypothetical protein